MYGRPLENSEELQQSLGKNLVPPAATGSAFSLSSLLLFTTLISICLGFFSIHPLAGMLVLFLAIPTLFRTITVTNHRLAHGKPVSCAEKVDLFAKSGAEFLASVAFAGAVGIAAIFGLIFLGFLVEFFVIGMLRAPRFLPPGVGLVFLFLGLVSVPLLASIGFAWSLRKYWVQQPDRRSLYDQYHGDESVAAMETIHEDESVNAIT